MGPTRALIRAQVIMGIGDSAVTSLLAQTEANQ
jgi:hypothetical protein